MAGIETGLQQLRDAAFLNQGALAAVTAQAQAQFDAIRMWPDSPMKRELLRSLGTTISMYRSAYRQASGLFQRSSDALASITDAEIPPLPTPDQAGVGWSVSDW